MIKYIDKKVYRKDSKNYKDFGVFFDRDGVLIEDKHYIKDQDKVALESNSKLIVREFFNRGWKNIIVTNQSGISRGYSSWEDYDLVTEKMLELFEEPNPFFGIYANSFLEHKNNENWRKPNPNMILDAAKEFNINLEKSILIGDRLSDMEAGANAGIKLLIHVETGHGIKEKKTIKTRCDKLGYFNSKVFKSKIMFIQSLKFLKVRDLISSTELLID